MKKVNNIQQFKIWSFVIFIILGFYSCKKYDENIILLALPEKVLSKLSGAHIVYCKVNGIDSTSNMLRILPTYTSNEFHFMPYKNDISIESSYYFNCIVKENGKDIYYRFDLSKNKREISILPLNNIIDRFLPIQTYQMYAPYAPKYHIKKLTPKDMKLTITYYNKEYEIYMSK